MKFCQKHEDGGIIILDNLNKKEMNNPRVQAMFKRSRRNILPFFINSQDFYELAKRTIRGNVYHCFKPNSFRDVKNLYQDKASMDMIIIEFKNLTNNSWDEKKHPALTFDMTEYKYTGRYRLGLDIIFTPDSSLF